jgi:hypothetical protein
VLNEGPPETNGASVRIVYPRQNTNNGSASVGADQPVQTDWITFRGAPGSENFYVIWSASPISELESAKYEAFRNVDGGVTDQNLVNVRNFVKTREAENPVRVTRYKLAQVATVRGQGDILITVAQIKHR